jgi:hypothetical protein
MATKKKILLVGIDPFLIDFSSPEFAAFPGLSAEKVAGGIKAAIQELNELGYDAEYCWTDFGQTAVAALESHLNKTQFDCVLIGAGIRIPEKNFQLFERMVNTIHKHAPAARISFNTNPRDTVEAVQRWS